MRVLVVEDDAIERLAISETLRRKRYEVVTAADGGEALEILASGSCRLVITDWLMPEVNGIQLCRAIRSVDFGATIYVIVVTSLDDPRDMRSVMDAGANAFILKPWSRRQLLARVRGGERALRAADRGLATGEAVCRFATEC